MSDPRRCESGAVLVVVALALPVLVMFFAWILDFGNGAVHRRHLQTQADAAALAGAQQLGALVNCNPTDVRQRALQYAGALEYSGSVAGVAEPKRNLPRQQDSHAVINRIAYFNQPGKLDSTWNEMDPVPPDDADPCEHFLVDVKTTQQDVPRFIPGIPGLTSPSLDFLNGHARVRIETASAAEGMLPVAVEESEFKRIRVSFINADTGTVLQTADLTETGVNGGMGIWSTSEPVSVPISAPHIEVRVAASASNATVTCGDPLVFCYDATSTSRGLVHVRGYTTPDAAPATPQVGEVDLIAGSCPDGYFVYHEGSCTVGVTAHVTSSDPTLRVWAMVGTDAKNAIELTKGAGSIYTGSGLEIDATAGRRSIRLQHGASNCNNTNCRITMPGDAHRLVRASEAVSGPVQMVRIGEGADIGGANAFPRCGSGCERNLTVTVGVQGSLEIAEPDDPPVVLRLKDGSSRTGALDCDPAIANLTDELAQGCAPQYEINTGTACPQPSVQSTPQPWDCVDSVPGNKVGQIPRGLNLRILGDENASTCTAPNQWPDIEVGDPRILQMFIVPFGSFSENGSGSVPVTNFATFYVTGWQGQPGSNPCSDEGDDPLPDGAKAVIVGHFIKYVLPGGGQGSGQVCDPDGLTTCIPVLTE